MDENKYQIAFNLICKPTKKMIGRTPEGEEKNVYEHLKIEFDLLQELVDWSEQNFTYILVLRGSHVGFPTRIAFHTESEAYLFASRNNLKGCSLDLIQYGKL